jgi:hypothetical protein
LLNSPKTRAGLSKCHKISKASKFKLLKDRRYISSFKMTGYNKLDARQGRLLLHQHPLRTNTTPTSSPPTRDRNEFIASVLRQALEVSEDLQRLLGPPVAASGCEDIPSMTNIERPLEDEEEEDGGNFVQ